jgi:very-short-patch-repair endonuclease
MNISQATRRDIIDYLIAREKPFSGKLNELEFLGRIWDLSSMPSTDNRYSNANGDIFQHRTNNNDWDDHYFLCTYLELITCDDEIFTKFLENCIHPIVLPDIKEASELLLAFNDMLKHDGFVLRETTRISGKPVYKTIGLRGGVQSNVKNLIFAANGFKPEIVLIDAVSNDIQIVKNEEYCLVYNKPILERGLFWTDLIEWWSEQPNITSLARIDQEGQLYQRLLASLTSPPETLLFRAYFKQFRQEFGDNLPALVPQVYLHYDPKTISQLSGGQRLVRQRMDFLLLFSNHDRVVLEVDGQQHYSVNNIAKPDLYAKMVAEDRRLRLSGYEIYRFGGYELQGEQGRKVVIDFFNALFQHHSVKK